MTTTASPGQGQPRTRTPRVLLVAGACVAAAVSLAGILGALADGAPGGLGALTGGGLVGAFLVLGSAVVNAVVRMAPQAAMVVAMMTYTLLVVLVLVVFLALSESESAATSLSSAWLATGVIAATIAWTVGQMVASARARIPAYDVQLPGEAADGAADPSGRREVSAP
jgi:ATP synthase protein I